MCGIIGYTGNRKASKILVKGLSRLEYRGYDSAGVAILNNNSLSLKKKQGKLTVLAEELKQHPLKGSTGIGHTRWATHGVPNDINAHPHMNCENNIAIVHNGIIENYQSLKHKLQEKGHKFHSETDSEVIAHLISINYKGDLRVALQKAIKNLEGSFAIGVIHKDEPGRIVGARRDSPMIVGLGNKENFIASDIPAVLEYTKEVIYLNNDEIVDLTCEKCCIYDSDGK